MIRLMVRHGIVLLWLTSIAGCFSAPPAASEPGPVSAPAIEPIAEHVYAHADADGPGWRIRDSTFESVHEALRVRPLPGWRLLAPGEPDSLLVTAGVGLLHERLGIELYFRRPGWMHAGDEQEQARVEAWRAEATRPAPSWVAELDGVRLDIEAHTGPAEHIRSQLFVHGQLLDVLGRHPAGTNRELLRGAIREALAAIEVLDFHECAELRRELDRSAPERDLLGDGWSLRGDVYRNFDLKLRIQIPSRAMEVLAGTRAKQGDSAYELIFVDRGRLRRGTLLAYDLIEGELSPEEWNEHALQYGYNIGIDKKGPLRQQRFGDALGLTRTLEDPRDDELMHLSTVIGEQHLLLMSVAGGAESKWDDDLAALLMLEIDDDMQRSRTVAGRYFDAHAGFAIDTLLPVDVRTDHGDVTGFFFSQTYWTHGGEKVEILAQNFEPIAGPIEGFLRARMEVLEAQATSRNPPEWVELSTPQPGRYLMWIDRELRYRGVALFVRGRTIYELNVESRREQLFAQALASFELLD
jgi:hypothetical protein